MWCVVVCDLENLVNEETLAHWGAVAPRANKQSIRIYVIIFRLGRKATVSFVMSVFPSAWNISAATGRIFLEI